MAVFLQRAEQAYTARVNPYTVNATVPGGATINRVKVTLTRVSWPDGPVGEVTLTFPDGSTSGFTFSGGVVLKKDGSTLLATTCEFSKTALVDGVEVVIPFPPGAYSLAFKALQTITTAVTVERF